METSLKLTYQITSSPTVAVLAVTKFHFCCIGARGPPADIARAVAGLAKRVGFKLGLCANVACDCGAVMAETRKLAAILAADVVGYNRLAGADEDRTLARLRALRSDLIDPTIAAHHGRVIKRTGDGILIEFRSVVDTVRCAIEVYSY